MVRSGAEGRGYEPASEAPRRAVRGRGPTEQGNLREVTIGRRGEALEMLDLYDYLLKGDSENDVVLD